MGHDLKVPKPGRSFAVKGPEISGSWLPDNAAVNSDFHDGRSSKDGSILLTVDSRSGPGICDVVLDKTRVVNTVGQSRSPTLRCKVEWLLWNKMDPRSGDDVFQNI